MKSKLVSKLLKETSLETRIEVSIQAYFIMKYGGTLFIPLDENGNDMPEAVEANKRCLEEAAPLLKMVLNDIKQWKEDVMREAEDQIDDFLRSSTETEKEHYRIAFRRAFDYIVEIVGYKTKNLNNK